MVRTIFAQPDPESVWAQHRRVVDHLTNLGMDTAADRLDGAGTRDTRLHRVPQGELAPDLVQQPPRTTQQGIRRRTNVAERGTRSGTHPRYHFLIRSFSPWFDAARSGLSLRCSQLGVFGASPMQPWLEAEMWPSPVTNIPIQVDSHTSGQAKGLLATAGATHVTRART